MPDTIPTSEKIQLLDWIKNNPNVFGYLLLLFVIGWQYKAAGDERLEAIATQKALQTTIYNLQTEAYRTEKERRERSEILLNALSNKDATPK